MDYENFFFYRCVFFVVIKVLLMKLEIRPPKMHELKRAIEIIYSAFKGEFRYIFGKYFDFGEKILISFYKKTIKEEDLENFLIVKAGKKIIATANLDFKNPTFARLLKFLLHFLKLNVHFLRAAPILGIKRAIRITMSMYWFFIENFRRNSCYINLLAVSPGFHNRGIGTKLIQAIEKVTREKRLRSITLDVCFGDIPARYLYKKTGFSEERHFSNIMLKYLNAIDGVFAMQKPLPY